MNQVDEQLSQPSGENYGEYDEQSYVYHESGDVDESTIYTDVKSKRNRMDNYLITDPGHKVIGTKKDRLEYYAGSVVTGASIRNAVTGIREYNMKVGNWNAESQFFKVRYLGDDSTNNPDVLYYDSPEQFERHMHCGVKQQTKQKWQRQYAQATQPSANL
jgi:hypothetical protein